MADGRAKLDEVRREVAGQKAQLSDCSPKVKKDLANLERELATLKGVMRSTKPKAELLAPPTADVTVLAAPASSALAKPGPKPAPVKVSPPPAPPKQGKQFPPSVKKGKLPNGSGKEIWGTYDIPDGIIAHLTRECGGNVHDRHVVDVTCGSLEKETVGVNPHSGAYNNTDWTAAKNAADLENGSCFWAACRKKDEDIPHTRNNWVCYNFKKRRIVPTHYTIRTIDNPPGSSHLKSWLVETSADGESWQEVAREDDKEQLNGNSFTATFAVADGGECRFIRLVQIGRNHAGIDSLRISA
jgi:hypothetical protein